MTTHPDFGVQDLPEQPYVGVTRGVTMGHFAPVADRIPELIGWLAGQGVPPTEPPFLRYRVIDMARELVVQAGVPLAGPVEVGGDYEFDVLPAGRYVTTTYVGHPDSLIDVTADLLRWADERGLAFDVRSSDAGEVWGCRLEIYQTNPLEVPDLSQWRTTLAFRLAD